MHAIALSRYQASTRALAQTQRRCEATPPPFAQTERPYQAAPTAFAQTQRGGGALAFTFFFVLPLIYILSTGPAAKLEQTLFPARQPPALDHALNIIYEPIIRGAEKYPAFNGALDWYCSDVWQVK